VLDCTSAKQSRVVSVLARVRVHDLSLLLLAIAAAWLLAASHWIFTDTVVPWDAKNQFYAFFRFLAFSFHEGFAPFWNPWIRSAATRSASALSPDIAFLTQTFLSTRSSIVKSVGDRYCWKGEVEVMASLPF